MKQIFARVAALAAVLVVAQFSSAGVFAQAAKVDLTGKWVFNVTTDAGTGTPTMTMKQDGEKLTGHYSGQLGESDFTGTVKANEFSFAFAVDAQGMKLDITYTGTVESKDALKGTVSIAGLGDGTFTAKRQ
jgi:hypothetical protein